MESMWSFPLWVLVVLLQVIWCGSVASEPCSSEFVTDLFRFRVQKNHLQKNTHLGTVYFNDCSGRAQILFESSDKRFHVNSDGEVKVKRPLTLHNGHKRFTVHAWDSTGKKHSAHVMVENVKAQDKEAADSLQIEFPSEIAQISFPKIMEGSKRIKREWVIPVIRIQENTRGSFPALISQIKSSHAKETTMEYRIKGEGADQPPVGLFSIKKSTGELFVARPLDREAKASYVLQAEAFSPVDTLIKEPAMEILIEVTDQNDNAPVFIQNPFLGSVPESSKKGFEFMTVNATDADDPATYNAEVRYSIINQTPPLPQPDLFAINPISGVIRVNVEALDREKYPKYTLEIQAADMEGNGIKTTGTAVITISDSNDHPPQFEKTSYNVSVPENKVKAVVVRMPVTDRDDAHSPAWNAIFRIVDGNSAGCFNVSTASNSQEGIISTVKPLDFEGTKKYTLLVVVENEVPLAVPLPYSTATVTVNVQDVNEPPVFDPPEKIIPKSENLAVDTELVQYTANDPDDERSQKVTYRVGNDPAGWLNIDKDTGLIRVKSEMDRESPFVVDGKYKALILAVDNDVVPATGTGTLVIELQDVNDHAPTIDERMIKVCNSEPSQVLLSITDKDGPQFAAPYAVELIGDSKNNWTARMNETKTGIILQLNKQLEQGDYNVVLRVFDNEKLSQENTIHAQVCDCTGAEVVCKDLRVAGFGLTGILGILGAILALLLLVLLLLLFVRRKKTTKKDPLITDDDTRDNVYYYDEEGGGEDDQDYDLSVLHRGLDNRPDVFRNDVAPTFMPAPQYRPRPANPEEIGTFIDDNLKAADNDPTAPPYDSLLVFDYEGGGSDAGSLSSLNSSSSGDQDYDQLNEWGPRFRKLADMYGGGED